MIDFLLSGIFAPIYGNSSFLIPFFTNKHSNEVFVQDLDEQYMIKRFMKANPESFRDTHFRTNGTVKKVGQPGILAYRIDGSEIRIGELEDIKQKVQNERLDLSPSMFFNLDAYTFIGDEEKALIAIEKACRLFQVRKFAHFWENTEKSVVETGIFHPLSKDYLNKTKLYTREDDIDKAIRRLIDDRYSSRWHISWSDAWGYFNKDKRLAELAEWWITTKSLDSQGVYVVIKRLLMDGAASRSIIDASIDIIRKGEDYGGWLDIWHGLIRGYKLDFDEAEFLIAHGWRYITEDYAKKFKGGITKWSKCWIGLMRFTNSNEKLLRKYNSKSLSVPHSLISIAISSFPNAQENSHFMSTVVPYVLRNRITIDKPAKEAMQFVLFERNPESDFEISVLNWLMERSNFDKPWTDVYVNYPDVRRYPELIEKAVRWLTLFVNVQSNWARVWLTTNDVNPNDRTMHDLAIEWLSNEYIDNRLYPSILLEIWRNKGVDGYTAKFGEKWLSIQNRTLPMTREISAYLGSMRKENY